MDEISKDQKKRIRALNGLNFMKQHPAFATECFGDSLFDGAWLYMAKCCKRGLSEDCKRVLSVYKGDKGWKNVKNLFE